MRERVGAQPGKLARLWTRIYRTLYFRISFRISDSIHFMHYQSEFPCDPFQDRPAEKGGEERVELETWRSGAFRETFSQHAGDVSSLPSYPRVCSSVH